MWACAGGSIREDAKGCRSIARCAGAWCGSRRWGFSGPSLANFKLTSVNLKPMIALADLCGPALAHRGLTDWSHAAAWRRGFDAKRKPVAGCVGTRNHSHRVLERDFERRDSCAGLRRPPHPALRPAGARATPNPVRGACTWCSGLPDPAGSRRARRVNDDGRPLPRDAWGGRGGAHRMAVMCVMSYDIHLPFSSPLIGRVERRVERVGKSRCLTPSSSIMDN